MVIADEVCRTLFEDFAAHRRGQRGEEEIGWMLLGRREDAEVIVEATLPAGANRDSSATHFQFNPTVHAVASRILRRQDKRLGMVGVVHTHPGSLRHPSGGDLRGDALWVGRLRGGEGVFAIGTADAHADTRHIVQETPARQVYGSLCFSWYTLRKGDVRYRTVPVQLTLGSDLARPLHAVWDTLETHAEPLDRLLAQLNQVSVEPSTAETGPAVLVKIPLSQPASSLRVLLQGRQARYYVEKSGNLCTVEPRAQPIDRAVYLILAEQSS